jgi:hypothetical protein
MIYVGLLTDAQKRAGCFVMQDEDSIYLFHKDNGKPRVISVFLYETVTIKEVRDAAEHYLLEHVPVVKG